MAANPIHHHEPIAMTNGNTVSKKDRAGRLAKSVAEEQISKLTKKMDLLASALTQASGQLKEQEEGKQISEYLLSISEQVEKASVYLRNSTLGDLIETARNQVRSRPALVLGGALITGYILARAMKNKNTRGYV